MSIFKNYEKLEALTLCFILNFSALSYGINGLCEIFLGQGFSWDSLMLYASLWALLFLTLCRIRNISKGALIFLMVFVGSILLTNVLYPENTKYLFESTDYFFEGKIFQLIQFGALVFLISNNLKNTQYLLEYLRIYSSFIVVLFAIYYVIASQRDIKLQYMTFSYDILLPVTVLMLSNIYKGSFWNLALGALGMFLIIIGGCRGALISCIISTVIFFLVYKKQRSFKQVLGLAVIIIIFLLIVVNLDVIIQLIIDILGRFDISSRTLELAMEGAFFEDSGRSILHDYAMENLNFFGYGLFGDRVLLNGRYVHNLFLEIVVDFGILFGFFIVVSLSYVIFKAIRKANNIEKLLICILLSAGVFKLMFSSSFLAIEPCFYAVWGYCIRIFSQKRIGPQKTLDNY